MGQLPSFFPASRRSGCLRSPVKGSLMRSSLKTRYQQVARSHSLATSGMARPSKNHHYL